LVCTLNESFDCTGTKLAAKGASYDRISVLAVKDPRELPSLAEGFDRLVTTNAIEIPITPKARK
jgi:hypothetical protein